MPTDNKKLFGGFAAFAVLAYASRSLMAARRLAQRKAENIYETKKSVDEYVLMHYGGQKELCPYADGPHAALEFPFRCAKECIDLATATEGLGPESKVLDLGCAVGGATFHLAKYFENVVGLDFSHAFVDTANEIKEAGTKTYTYVTEGDLRDEATLEIDSSIDRKRCTFVQGDACNLDIKKLGGPFQVVLGANLVCRLPDPSAFLNSCRDLIAPGGFLVLPSPYTWLTQYTAKSRWVGGYMKDGKPVRSIDGLRNHLEKDFDLVKDADMQFFIKETHRKHQWTVSHLTVWRRKQSSQ